jgi:FixJ family two-component response regulator
MPAGSRSWTTTRPRVSLGWISSAKRGFVVRAFPSAEEFLDFGRVPDCSCPTADIHMPGFDLQARLNGDRLRVPIFITAHGDQQVRMRALRAGAVEFLEKPFDPEVLLDTLRAAQER